MRDVEHSLQYSINILIAQIILLPIPDKIKFPSILLNTQWMEFQIHCQLHAEITNESTLKKEIMS